MVRIIIELISLFLAGILAGEEFVVRYGVHVSLSSLDEPSHIRVRQSLIRRLRILVPAIILPTAASSIVALILDGTEPGFAFRCAGVASLLILFLTTIFGTLPINKSALDWQPDAPPKHWRQQVDRWGKLDVIRVTAAILSFAFLLIATAIRLAGS